MIESMLYCQTFLPPNATMNSNLLHIIWIVIDNSRDLIGEVFYGGPVFSENDYFAAMAITSSHLIRWSRVASSVHLESVPKLRTR